MKRVFKIKNLIFLIFIVFVFLSVNASSDDSKLIERDNLSGAALSTNSEILNQKLAGIEAEAVLISDLRSNKTIYEINSNKRWPMASLTKLMTSIVALKLMPEEEIIPITSEVIRSEGASGNFSPGEKFKLSALIKAMLLVSSNDAAEAIALHYGKDRFLQIMNAEARDLKMNDTVFSDSSGISLQNLSTAADLQRLINFIFLKNPKLLKITREKSASITEEISGESRELRNINLFALRSDFLGGKTGTMPQVGGNLISVFDIQGPKAIIVLGADDKFKETEKIMELWFNKK